VIQNDHWIELSQVHQRNHLSGVERKYSMTTEIHINSTRQTAPFGSGVASGAEITALAIRTGNQAFPRNPRSAISAADEIFAECSLVERLVNRDGSALEELFDRMSRRAFGLAYRILGDGPAAEDVVQEVFIWIWDNSQKLDASRGTIDGLILTLAHRSSVDALRARKRRSELPTTWQPSHVEAEVAELVDEVQRNLDADAIRQAIKKLPADQIKVVEMAYFGGMTHVEISSETNLPLGTVKSRLRLAMSALRKAFGLQKPTSPAESGGAS